MSKEEYIAAITRLLIKINDLNLLERIYSYVNRLYVGRGRN